MSDTTTKALAASTGFVLVAVIVTGALAGARSIEAELGPRAEQALAAAGLTDVDVHLEGREADLSGGTPADLVDSVSVVEGVRGIRLVRIRTVPGTHSGTHPTATPSLELRRTVDGLTISGTVADADAAAELKAAAAESFAATVTGDLGIDARVGAADWVTAMPTVLNSLVAVKGLVLTVGDGGLELGGSIESRAAVDDVEQLVAVVVPELSVNGHLRVVRGSLSEDDASTLTTTSIHFAPGRSTLRELDATSLKVVARILRQHPRVAVQVGSHAGPNGPARTMRLGRDRVAKVRRYLIDRGVDASRITTRSHGPDVLATDSSSRQYRRVDFVIEET